MPADDEEDYETEDDQFIRRIQEDPEEAAAFYRKLADETRKEFKFLEANQQSQPAKEAKPDMQEAD